MEINASMVKELREATGAGMMDCKKALVESNGDMDKAADYLREKGISKAAKKASRIAAEGLSNIFIKGNKALVLEVNSETDFVAKNEDFKKLIDTIGNTLIDTDVNTLEDALKVSKDGDTIDTLIVNATAKIGEKISFRRMEVINKKDNEVFGSYIHMGGKISSVVVLTGTDEAVAKDVAMQVAAMKPLFISSEFVPSETLEHEKEVLRAQVLEEGKAPEMVDRIVMGKISKYYEEVCLLDQFFFKEDKKKVKDYLKDHNAQVVSMIRYEVGEGMEKRSEDFAQEVKSQLQ